MIQTFDQNNKQSTTLFTFTLWNTTLLKNGQFMSSQWFIKGGQVEKSVIGKKIEGKTDFIIFFREKAKQQWKKFKQLKQPFEAYNFKDFWIPVTHIFIAIGFP